MAWVGTAIAVGVGGSLVGSYMQGQSIEDAADTAAASSDAALAYQAQMSQLAWDELYKQQSVAGNYATQGFADAGYDLWKGAGEADIALQGGYYDAQAYLQGGAQGALASQNDAYANANSQLQYGTDRGLGYLAQSADTVQGLYNPYIQQANTGLEQLNSFDMNGPSYDDVVTNQLGNYEQSAGFQAQNTLAQQDLQRELNARGLNYSATGATAAAELEQQLTAADYDKYRADLEARYNALKTANSDKYGMIMQNIGLGQYGTTGAAQTQADLGTNQANLASQLGTNQANLSSQLGTNTANIYSGLGSSASGLANTFGTNQANLTSQNANNQANLATNYYNNMASMANNYAGNVSNALLGSATNSTNIMTNAGTNAANLAIASGNNQAQMWSGLGNVASNALLSSSKLNNNTGFDANGDAWD